MLAKSWEMSNGFRNWKFELQEGVQWHFGWGEFTSADVAHTHYLLTQEEAAGNFKGLWVDGKPNIIDDYTIEFVFDPPMVDGLRLFSRLAGDMVIQSKAQWDAGGGVPAAYDDTPAGTGSYQYGGRRLGESIWFEKIEGEHWNGENPDFQELEWVWAAEQFTRLSQLLAGEVQGADLAREVQVDALNAGMKIISSNNENNQSYGIFGGNYLSTVDSDLNPWPDGRHPHLGEPIPWHDIRVREALNRAIDRDAIIDELYQGRASRTIVPVFAPFTEGWNDRWVEEFDERYGYDPQRSIELLAEAGYAPGEVVIESWSTVIPGNPEFPQLIEVMSTMWEEAGFSTTIQDWDFGAWLDTITEHGIYDKFVTGRNTPIRTTQEGLRIFFASEPHGFVYGYEDDFINEQYNCLRESVDAEEREQCARAAGDYIFEQYAMLPMFQITFDMTVNPEFIADWQFPGVGSAHPTHEHNIKACPVGTDRCD
jgi:ABC-type transport system substrate-binding protein